MQHMHASLLGINNNSEFRLCLFSACTRTCTWLINTMPRAFVRANSFLEYNMFNFGEHLKTLRKSHNITQKQLAHAINASERGIQQYELGERKPSYDSLIALADYFEVSIDYLVGRSDDPSRR